jgi:hypothetical protein
VRRHRLFEPAGGSRPLDPINQAFL